ncbi:MAG TPA: hypothetical protein VLI04_10920 [Nocardioidaceae bacterium]|nr:hypothetical protein [Nocardioidaceae bacterium]
MWLTWGALSLLGLDVLLQVTGTVDFAASMWVVLAVTVVGSVFADMAIGRLRAAAEPLRVPVSH